MEPIELEVRNATYAAFAREARAPTAREIAAQTGLTPDDLEMVWRDLHEAHALVLDEATGELRMANPFSAVPTPFTVHARGRTYFANCAWDAFGVCAALGVDGDIETACPDCAAPLHVAVRDRRPDDETLLFHCLVPAALWWEDIVFT